MSDKRCSEECKFYEPENTWLEVRGPGLYEQMGEPPCCKFGGEPYDNTFVGERCPYLGVVRDER